MLLHSDTVRQVEHHKLMCQHSQVISHYIVQLQLSLVTMFPPPNVAKAVGSMDCPLTLLGAVVVEYF